MFSTILARLLAIYSIGIFLFSFSTLTFAECSDKRVKQLSEKGRTVTSIAKSCKMSKQDVNSILEEGSDEDEDSSSGLSSGSPVGQCGCWGTVDPSYLQLQENCQSGYAKPSMCNSLCPAGGYAWRGVCT